MLNKIAPHRHALALAGGAASWGIATVIAKYAVSEIPPTVLLPAQLTASLLLVGPLMLFRRERFPWSPQLRRLGYLGILNPGISYALSLVGLTYITASLSVLLWATEPLLIIGFAWWFLGDRIDRGTAVAALLALAGVVLVVFEAGDGHPVGVLLTLAGVAACAIYTVITRKWIATESTLDVVAIQQTAALGFALILAVSAAGLASSGIPDASIGAWVSALASGILYYGIAFWLYLTGLRGVRATTAGLFLTLIPVFGISAGYLFLNERLSTRQWLGAILIVVTLVATVRHQARSQVEAGSEAVFFGRAVTARFEDQIERPR
ncbi:MAG: DMT family transporter [Actinomycetota bacterium]